MDVVHPMCKEINSLFWVHWDRLFVVPIGCHPCCRTELSF
jgi:hypothetical protein